MDLGRAGLLVTRRIELGQIDSAAVDKSNDALALVDLIDNAVTHPAELDPAKAAVPYYLEPPLKGRRGRVARFPDKPGIYAIVRYFRHKGRLKPRVLYVGIACPSTLRMRLSEHIRQISNPDQHTGSRFANAMWEIVQSDEGVLEILKSPNTRIAAVALPGRSRAYLEQVERLCIQVLNPLLNIRE